MPIEAGITQQEAVLALKAATARLEANGALSGWQRLTRIFCIPLISPGSASAGAWRVGAQTAAQLFQKESAARKIITFCGSLDEILGGGVATSQITEFCEDLFLVIPAFFCVGRSKMLAPAEAS